MRPTYLLLFLYLILVIPTSLKQTFAKETDSTTQHRIISLAPHITELLYEVGAGDSIVGTVSFSDYPEDANDIPRIGNSDQISFEQVLALQPTLIFGWESGNGDETLNRLRSLGFAVHSHEPKTLEDIAKSLRDYGELTGNSERGQEESERFADRLETLREHYENKTSVSVFYQIWNEPKMTLNGAHLISDVIHLCGGTNVFADVIPLVPKVTAETVIQRAPEVIIGSGIAEERPEWLDEWNRWPTIPAAQNKHIYSIHPDLLYRHSPRILDGAEQMCELLDRARSD